MSDSESPTINRPNEKGPRADEPLTANADFRSPHSFKNRLGRLLWNCVYILAYRWTPPRLGMPWRKLVLRCFGAQIKRTWLHPSTRIWAPWLLKAGDDVFVDRECNLYNAYGIEICDRVVISMECFLCTASHDHTKRDFPLIGGAIVVESDSWIAAQVFVAPNVRIGAGSVIGARSVLTRDTKQQSIMAGNPARIVAIRKVE
jgi:putative colanic acid biosynthesis acetyltransferase WcaF